MTTTIAGQLGRQLYELERSCKTRARISAEHPDLDTAAAYAVQEAYASLRMSDGARLVGRKIGCTSIAMQELFGIDTPDYGHLFDDMVVGDGATIDRSRLIQPMVEIEVTFFLDQDLQGPGITRDDVLEATSAVAPSIEIIDSRITSWDIGFIDTVADNGSSARCVIGPGRTDPATVELPAIRGQLWRNGALVEEALASAVLGHPADAVAWLANAIGSFGRSLHAGELVMSGALMRAVPAEAGDHFEARFTDLGTVACAFS